MNPTLFPNDPSLEDFWFHKLAKDIATIVLSLCILISVLILTHYYTRYRETQRIKAIIERVTISTILRKTPGKSKMYVQELGREVKKHNPEYNDIKDSDLALAVMRKYPRYRTYSYYSESIYEPNSELLKLIPILLAIGLFLPGLIYRALIPTHIAREK